MSLEQISVVDKIEVIENGCVQVRVANRIIDGTNIIAENYSRSVILPGDDYSKEDSKVQAICGVVHTQEVITAYQTMIAEQKTKL